jgi:ubiquinone/menaquinone biosynthesis C-methylase UbiE
MAIQTDLKNKIILEPCVGTGNLLVPLIGKGAVLIGVDIDEEALKVCKERIPEAILTNCNTLLCYVPSNNQNLKYGRYCSQHIFNEPQETISRLERILQQRKESKTHYFFKNHEP